MEGLAVSYPAVAGVPFVELLEGQIDTHRVPFLADREQKGLVHGGEEQPVGVGR